MEEYKIIEVEGYKIAYRPGTSDEEVIRDTLKNDIFFKGFPEYKIAPDHIVMDIGAHIGVYSLQLSSKLTNGQVYAFEPCLDTYSLLEENLKLNKLNNVSSFKIALTDYIGTTKLYYDIEHGNWGHSIVKSFSENGEIVQTDTLSNFFKVNNLKKCDFIKFNCEGAEFRILLSTPIEILKQIDNMLVLYHMDLTEEFTVNQLIDHLKESGFYTEIRNIEDAGKRGWLLALRVNAFRRIILKIKYNLRPIGYFSLRIVNKIKRTVGYK